MIMFAKSCSMEYRSFFLRPSISAAKDPDPDPLGSEEEEEDGDLYAELWQQILQLTSDSDDNPAGRKNQGPCQVTASSPVTCSDWRVNRNVEPSPVWWLSPPRSGSGTGVFIPSIAVTEGGGRHGRAARKKKKKSKAKKQVENK